MIGAREYLIQVYGFKLYFFFFVLLCAVQNSIGEQGNVVMRTTMMAMHNVHRTAQMFRAEKKIVSHHSSIKQWRRQMDKGNSFAETLLDAADAIGVIVNKMFPNQREIQNKGMDQEVSEYIFPRRDKLQAALTPEGIKARIVPPEYMHQAIPTTGRYACPVCGLRASFSCSKCKAYKYSSRGVKTTEPIHLCLGPKRKCHNLWHTDPNLKRTVRLQSKKNQQPVQQVQQPDPRLARIRRDSV